MKAGIKVVLAAVVAVVVFALPASAAPAKNACGLLKTSEIKAEFGPDVGKGKKDIGPACTWKVEDDRAASGSGTVSTFLLRSQGKAAFNGLKEADPDYSPIDGLGKDAYFLPSTGTVAVLKSSKIIISVQGVFLAPNGLDNVAIPELEAKLTVLAKKALKRA